MYRKFNFVLTCVWGYLVGSFYADGNSFCFYFSLGMLAVSGVCVLISDGK